ncbi:hypothetical protein FZC83_02220 [Rossellomorea marisflavi]|uniref:Uncharacterized protein n=1 Tax=Rossellomorea marisflavi TaxID=189381 RepID=A0A5D4S3G8_9BACI|nr:hypothetical protein [Rossellomorea marisflavi]TYS56412.1 hypothetical protein FZC83_02220 [Rossellomorea marisflavi]
MLYKQLDNDELEVFIRICRRIRKEQSRRFKMNSLKSNSMRIWIKFNDERENLVSSPEDIRKVYSIKYKLIEKDLFELHTTHGVYNTKYINLTDKGAELVRELKNLKR